MNLACSGAIGKIDAVRRGSHKAIAIVYYQLTTFVSYLQLHISISKNSKQMLRKE